MQPCPVSQSAQHPKTHIYLKGTHQGLLLSIENRATTIFKAAQATGQNIAGKKSNIKTAKVKFEATSFEEFLDKYESKYQHTKQLLESVNREHLELEYNDLRSPQGFEEVLRFLKVNEEVMRTPTKKRNSDSILERFTNPKVVRDYLKSKDLQKWITEKQ